MPKGTARKHRKIREMKQKLGDTTEPSEPCLECGNLYDHAEWCMAEEEDGWPEGR